jgi:gelsolin
MGKEKVEKVKDSKDKDKDKKKDKSSKDDKKKDKEAKKREKDEQKEQKRREKESKKSEKKKKVISISKENVKKQAKSTKSAELLSPRKKYSPDPKTISAVQAKFEESNIAAIGSQEDIDLRVAAAKTEEAWRGVGQTPGIQIWRIEQFTVVPWPKELYGKFYDGDSYIVLHTYKDQTSGKMLYDVHFWLGLFSSQDEIGTAAYKTVELDDLLGSLPIQYREVQGQESDLFLSYFPTIETMNGGVDTGFNIIDLTKRLTEYKTKLLWVKGRGNNIQVRQVPLQASSLNSGDVFVLDVGNKLITWHGKASSRTEQYKAATLCVQIKNERPKIQGVTVLTEGEDSNNADETEFWSHLPGDKDDIREDTDDEYEILEASDHKVLYRISDSTGELLFTLAGEDNLSKNMLDPNDAFLLDLGNKIFVWVGNQCSTKERKFAMSQAALYAKENHLPLTTPIVRVVQGHPHAEFDNYFK